MRQGLKLILVELGKGLERRGDDLNGAVLALRPGLEAADEALAEVRSQNAALRSLIADAEAVTGQAAARSRELGQPGRVALGDAADDRRARAGARRGARAPAATTDRARRDPRPS